MLETEVLQKHSDIDESICGVVETFQRELAPPE